MKKSYFLTDAYLEYLRQHCRPGLREDVGRVPGIDLIERALDEMNLRPGEKVLEIGCGLGRVLSLLKTRYGLEAYGCDVSPPAIAEAKRFLPELADRLFVSSAECIITDEEFDHVVTWGVFEMTNQKAALAEISRLVRVGGSAILCAVKSSRYHIDDEESRAAHRAYIAQDFPITFSAVNDFEALLAFLGFVVSKRLVFDRKSDVAKQTYRTQTADEPPPSECSDIYYIISKQRRTPLDRVIQIAPRNLSEPTR